jgi:5-hydroxyisourate hydrolase
MTMAGLSTHVLDTSVGSPATGVRVSLLTRTQELLGSGTTDHDGRVAAIGPEDLAPGDYELRFDTGGYFATADVTTFLPEVVVVFTVAVGVSHYHVPVLLSPFGYSTYRGS